MNAGPSRVAVRLAVRRAWRRRARAALIVALVALPVAAMVLSSTALRSMAASEADAARWVRGHAAASYALNPTTGAADPAGTIGQIHAAEPSVRIVVTQEAGRVIRRGRDSVNAEVVARAAAEPLLDGRLVVESGRLATASNEIAASRGVLRATHARVGDTVDGVDGTKVVVGVIADAGQLTRPVAQIDIAALANAGQTVIYTDRKLNHPPRGVYPADYYSAGDESTVGVLLFGAIVLLAGSIVSASAFAVSSRRHVRELGVLGANGATPGQLAWIQAVEGVVFGVAGAVVGVVLGALTSLAASPLFDSLANHQVHSVRWSPADMVIAAALGTASAAGAAWMPARSVFTLPTLGALTGRRPATRVPRSMTALGVGTAIGGAALLGAIALSGDEDASLAIVFAFLAGPLLLIVGIVLLTVRLVAAIEGASRHFRSVTRIALRNAGRQRARSAAVVAAVMAAGAVTLGGSMATLSSDVMRARQEAPYNNLGRDQVLLGSWANLSLPDVDNRPVPESAVEQVAAALPGAIHADRLSVRPRPVPSTKPLPPGTAPYPGQFTIRVPDSQLLGERGAARPFWFTGGAANVATPQLLDALGLPGSLLTTVERHPVVLGALNRENVNASATSYSGRGRAVAQSLPVSVVATNRRELWGVALMTQQQVDALGLVAAPTQVLFRSPRPLTGAQRRTIQKISVPVMANGSQVQYFRPVPTAERDRLVLTGGAIVFTLVVVLLGLALMAAEDRVESTLLVALGASRRALARLRSIQAATLTALGGVLAVVLVAVPAITGYATSDAPFSVPWLAAMSVLMLIPLLATAAVGLYALLGGGSAVSSALLADDE